MEPRKKHPRGLPCPDRAGRQSSPDSQSLSRAYCGAQPLLPRARAGRICRTDKSETEQSSSGLPSRADVGADMGIRRDGPDSDMNRSGFRGVYCLTTDLSPPPDSPSEGAAAAQRACRNRETADLVRRGWRICYVPTTGVALSSRDAFRRHGAAATRLSGSARGNI